MKSSPRLTSFICLNDKKKKTNNLYIHKEKYWHVSLQYIAFSFKWFNETVYGIKTGTKTPFKYSLAVIAQYSYFKLIKII